MEINKLFKAFAQSICYDKNKKTQLPSDKGINALVPIAQAYRLSHLYYFSLKKNDCLPALTSSNRLILENAYKEVYKTNSDRIAELTILANNFEKANIEWLLLKEYAFDNTYNDYGAVQQNDFDILILDEDLDKARKLLYSMDYVFHESRYGKSYGEFRFKNPEKTSIDLHIRLMPNKNDWIFSKRNYTDIIEEAELLEIQGVKVNRMSPLYGIINMLIHTVLHHNFYPLSKMVNCWNYLISKQNKVDWDEVATKMTALKISNLGWFCISYIEEIIGYKSLFFNKFEAPSNDDIKLFRSMEPDPLLYHENETYFKFDSLTHQLNHKLLLFDSLKQRELINKWEENDQ